MSDSKDAIQRRDEAIELLEKHGQHTSLNHLRWLVDQMAQTLLGEEYEAWVEQYEKNGKAIPVRRWMTGDRPVDRDPQKPYQIHANDPEVPLILQGDLWVNRNTGKEVVILNTPSSPYMPVDIQHQSGRITQKQQHYFVYDYQKKGE